MKPERLSGIRRDGALLACVLAGMLCAKSFGINPQLFAGKGAVPAESTDLLWTFVGLVFTALFWETFARRALRLGWGEGLCGLLFGVLNYFGTTLFAYDSWAFIGVWQSWPAVIFKCLCQGFTMAAALRLVEDGLMGAALPLRREPKGLWGLVWGHPMAALCVCWLPYLAVFYPGIVVSDMAWMFEQLVGITQMSTWHSVLITWVFGGCVLLGRALGSDALGCALYMLLQTGALSYALGRVLKLLRWLGVSPRRRAAAFAFFAFFPIWPMYCATLWKDSIHTALMLLLLVQTMEISRGHVRPGRGTWAAYGLTALLGCLWRNNGAYVVLPSLVAFWLVFPKGSRAGLAGVGAGALAVTLLFQNVLVPALGIVDNTASGLYSVCFQQTARVVRDHGEELTEEEWAEIDRVLDVEQIGNLYEPWISDPVKYTYRQFGQGAEVEKEALSRYRHTWLAMLGKYPVSYLQAFMAGNRGYYAFIPKYTGVTYSQQAGMRFVPASYRIEGEGELNAPQPAALEGVRRLVYNVLERLRTLPMVQLLLGCALYTWTLVGAGLGLVRKRRLRELALFVPALLSFAVCLLSPVDDYFRYFLPVVAMTVPLLACVEKEEAAR